MSITIVYDRKFIKCGDLLYVPMALYGSSNCTTMNWRTGREVRERDWGLFMVDEKMLLTTEADMLEAVNKVYPKDAEEGESFVFRGQHLSKAEAYRFFENGIRNAESLESILWNNPATSLAGELRTYVGDFEYSYELSWKEEYMHDTADVEAWITKAKRRKAELTRNHLVSNVYILLRFTCSEPLKSSPVKDPLVPCVAYKIQKHRKVFLANVTDNSVSYDFDFAKAQVFANVEEAHDAIGQWARKGVHIIEASKVKPMKEDEKDYVLSLSNLGSQVFVTKKTRGCVYFTHGITSQTKRFASEKEALKWYESKIGNRFPELSNPTVIKTT